MARSRSTGNENSCAGGRRRPSVSDGTALDDLVGGERGDRRGADQLVDRGEGGLRGTGRELDRAGRQVAGGQGLPGPQGGAGRDGERRGLLARSGGDGEDDDHGAGDQETTDHRPAAGETQTGPERSSTGACVGRGGARGG